MREFFRRAAHAIAVGVGTPLAFGAALLVVLIWAGSGPFFHFSDTWQLVINTGTTIVTFLMVFLIQNSQNRDTRALQMKLDELIIYTRGADNKLIDLEKLSDEDLDRLEQEIRRLGKARGRGTPPPEERVAGKRGNGRAPAKSGRR
ncbi:MAG TPA: low affinity iron permease family protein [Dehalococcoidia bacterium]|nr:low affinity iron permease family protein [Dehalococcoidia bacterium]